MSAIMDTEEHHQSLFLLDESVVLRFYFDQAWALSTPFLLVERYLSNFTSGLMCFSWSQPIVGTQTVPYSGLTLPFTQPVYQEHCRVHFVQFYERLCSQLSGCFVLVDSLVSRISHRFLLQRRSWFQKDKLNRSCYNHSNPSNTVVEEFYWFRRFTSPARLFFQSRFCWWSCTPI